MNNLKNVISVRMNQEDLAGLKHYAVSHEMSVAAVVRYFVKKELSGDYEKHVEICNRSHN